MPQGIDNDYDGVPNASDPTPGNPQARLRAMLAKLSTLLGRQPPAAASASPERAEYNEAVGPGRAAQRTALAAPHANENAEQQAAENAMRGGQTFEQYHGARGRPVGTTAESRRGKLRELLTRLSEGSATGTEPAR